MGPGLHGSEMSVLTCLWHMSVIISSSITRLLASFFYYIIVALSIPITFTRKTIL